MRSGITTTKASTSLSASGACTGRAPTVLAATSPPKTLAAAFPGDAKLKSLVEAWSKKGGEGERERLLEHLADGLAVPHLLEDPAGQERRDLRVLVGRGEEEVPQVAHGVMLHVVHVLQ